MVSSDPREKDEKTSKRPEKTAGPPLLEKDDDIDLKGASFRNPALFFLLMVVPALGSLFFALTGHPAPERAPRQQEEPAYIKTPPAARQEAAAPGSFMNLAERGEFSKTLRFGVSPEAPPPVDPLAFSRTGCHFEYIQGKKLTQEILAAIARTGRPYRLLSPGYTLTPDPSPGRVNLELDSQGAIRNIWCG